ncbi:L,D-transpeptidase [Dactylosporangium sp. NPDC051485]|uniref:L,D-transpeptidase n=1 Tax=Dactylosporangium sp. NPDC051485 TaxID=3154846 RepID=UPI0034475350
MTDVSTPDRPAGTRIGVRAGLAGTVAAVIAGLAVAIASSPAGPPDSGPLAPGPISAQTTVPPSPRIVVPVVAAADLAALPESTTESTVAAAPLDPAPAAATGGAVAHNRTPLPVFDAPGGRAIAQLPARQAAADTWLPVIEQRPGWVRVLLPSRPNSATGWLDAAAVVIARTPYVVRVSLATARLDLIREDQLVGRWTVAIGAAATPTPVGRTFLLAVVANAKQTFSPLIIALGTHSPTLRTYRGGPATTAIHTWPDPSVFGRPVSNGCIRVPADALQILAMVPLGTIVHIQP